MGAACYAGLAACERIHRLYRLEVGWLAAAEHYASIVRAQLIGPCQGEFACAADLSHYPMLVQLQIRN
jgi:hypothetical protein